MALLDWIVIAVLLGSVLIGLMRGLIFEVISLAGWVVGLLVAQWVAADVAAWLPFGEADATWRYPLAFVLVFVLVVFGFGLFASVTRRLLVAVGLRPVDRMLGALFGVARAAVAMLVVAVVVHLLALSESAWWQDSRSALVLEAALQSVKPALPEKLASYLP